MALEMDSDGGADGQGGMEASPHAGAGVCPNHGVVTPVVVGNRWKCPNCGIFLKKPRVTTLALTSPTSGASLAEMLRRLEIREILRAMQSTVDQVPPEAKESVIDFQVVVRWIAYTEAQFMTLPLAGLEEILKRILARAAGLEELPQLYQDLESLQRDRSSLEEEIDELEGEKARLEERVAQLKATERFLEAKLRKVEEETGHDREEILRQLQNFANLQRQTNGYEAYLGYLQRDHRTLLSQLGQLQTQIARATADLTRLNAAKERGLVELANTLNLGEVQALVALVVRRPFLTVLRGSL